MVVIDEKSRVPQIDKAALGRLSHALDRNGVVAAMLIGSRARGATGPLSDVDIAVWHDPNLDPRGRFDLKLSLAGDAGRALGAGYRLPCRFASTSVRSSSASNRRDPVRLRRGVQDPRGEGSHPKRPTGPLGRFRRLANFRGFSRRKTGIFSASSSRSLSLETGQRFGSPQRESSPRPAERDPCDLPVHARRRRARAGAVADIDPNGLVTAEGVGQISLRP